MCVYWAFWSECILDTDTSHTIGMRQAWQVFCDDKWWLVFCFADKEHAEKLRARFGGECFNPKIGGAEIGRSAPSPS
jgi:hypothetical protein